MSYIEDKKKRLTLLEIDMAISSVMIDRIREALKAKKIKDTTEWIKTVSSSYWYKDAFKREYHRDGSYTPIPLNRFQIFLEYQLLCLPKDIYMKQIETALGYRENELLSYLDMRIPSKEAFLQGLGILDDKIKPTNRYYKLKTIKNYNSYLAKQDRKQKRLAAETEKQKKLQSKERKETLVKRLQRLATGIWPFDFDAAPEKEQVKAEINSNGL